MTIRTNTQYYVLCYYKWPDGSAATVRQEFESLQVARQVAIELKQGKYVELICLGRETTKITTESLSIDDK